MKDGGNRIYSNAMKKNLNTSRYTITIEGHCLPIIIRKHPTSRRIVIRYQPLTHSLGLTLPRYATHRQGLHFIEEKRRWIADQLRERKPQIPLTEGQVITVLGKPYILRHVGGRGVVKPEGDYLLVPGEPDFMARRVRDWVIAQAREEITRLARENGQQLGKQIRKITLRDTSSHWGSCSHDAGLSFSWRLAFAPYEVLEYVVCHEVAHLEELNHSPAFWAVVGRLCPHFRRPREWLKTHGGILYHYN